MLNLSSYAFSKYFPFLRMIVNPEKTPISLTEAKTIQATKGRSAKDQQEKRVVISESIEVTRRSTHLPIDFNFIQPYFA